MKAYKVIQKYGWVQGDYGNTKDGFCIIGALRYAGSWKRLARKVGKVLDVPADPIMQGYISDWNDNPVRTKKEVIALLKKVEGVNIQKGDKR